MNTLTAPEGKWLTQIDDNNNPIMIKEVTGAGTIDEQYNTASDYRCSQIIDN